MPRVLSEQEFDAVKQKVLAAAPPNLSEDDFKKYVGPAMAQALGEAENGADTSGSPFMRAATQFYEKSPIGAAVALVKGAGDAVSSGHPLDAAWDAVKGQAKAQWDQAVTAAQKAREAANAPNMRAGALSASEAVGHGLAAILPLIGPAAADVGEHGARGDVAGMAGGTLGLLTPFAAKYGIEAAKTGSPVPTSAAVGAAAADDAALLRRAANDQVAQRVLAPANPRYKASAQTIAPEMLDRKLPGDRLQLQQMAEDGMADSGAKIDAAFQAANTPLDPSGIVQALDRRIADFQVNGKTIPTATDRVAALTQIRDYLTKLGPNVDIDQLRKIRDEFYQTAKDAKVYERAGNQSVAALGQAAADAGSAIREAFAAEMPELVGPNADYTFWKRVSDILDPTMGRPKSGSVTTGVTGGLHTTGAIIGEGLSNVPGLKAAGALVVSKLLPMIREAQASPAWQMASAAKKSALADALERGDYGRARSALFTITKMAPRTLDAPPMVATGAAPAAQQGQR